MIKLTKKYKTRDGHKVNINEISDFNTYGKKTSFPVKGTIEKEDGIEYCIWTHTGAYLPGEHPHPNDLI